MCFNLATFKGGFWFRINGKCLSVSYGRPLLFSERNGYTPVYTVGKLTVKVLK